MNWQKQNFWKAHKRSVLLLTGVFLLAFGMMAQGYRERETFSGKVERLPEGSANETQTFFYHVDGGEQQEVTVDVHARERSREEAECLLEQAVSEWELIYLGENTSADEVMHDLNLPDTLCEGTVSVTYESSNYDVLTMDGALSWDHLSEEGELVELTAHFTYGDLTRMEYRYLKVMLPKKDSREWIRYALTKKIRETEAASREEDSFALPKQLGAYRISWDRPMDYRPVILLMLGCTAVFALEQKEREEERKRKKEREKQLLYEYPQMVDQLSLLIGSGMTIRRAWEKMILTARECSEKQIGKQKLYIREMWITSQEMQQGCGERSAYERFGTRIGLMPYKRLASLLSQSVTKGTKDLQKLLYQESKEALDMRKNQARRLGEEAGTKLLFPMLLSFLLILVVLLLPAVKNFS